MSGELPLKEYDDMIRNTVLTPLDTPIDPEDNKQTTEPPNEPISNPNPETNGDSVQNFTT